MNKIGSRSRKSISGITPELALVIGMALARGRVDMTFISGFRTAEEQNKLFKDKKSKCDGYIKRSFHQSGRAVDFIPCPFNGWSDREGFIEVWKELEHCAKHLGFEVGKFISWDIGHIQIETRGER